MGTCAIPLRFSRFWADLCVGPYIYPPAYTGFFINMACMGAASHEKEVTTK